MELISESMLRKLPPLYSVGDRSPEKIKVITRLFCPWGGIDWYIFEYDPVERVANAYVRDSHYCEFGLVSIGELEQVRGPLGMKIERTIYWDSNTRLSSIMTSE